jgi:hypothetical protein
MNPETLKNTLLTKLQKHDYNGLKGTSLFFHIPLQEKLFNIIIQSILSTSDKLQDFDSIYFSEMKENEFVLYLDHKKINKTLRCKILEIDNNHQSEPLLIIVFLEGIRFHEKVVLETVKTLKKGWNWFKTQWQDDSGILEKAKPVVEITSSSLKVNLSQILKQQDLDYLNPLISWKKISTHENKLIIDISFKI